MISILAPSAAAELVLNRPQKDKIEHYVLMADLVIRMFINDHPPAHFHAEYQGQEALFDIHTLDILKGNISHRSRLLVVEWALEHRQELLTNWEK